MPRLFFFVFASILNRILASLLRKTRDRHQLGTQFRPKAKRPAVRLGAKPRSGCLAVVLAPLVARDHAIFDVNHAMRIPCDIAFVRDQNDGVSLGLEAIKQSHDFDTGL